MRFIVGRPGTHKVKLQSEHGDLLHRFVGSSLLLRQLPLEMFPGRGEADQPLLHLLQLGPPLFRPRLLPSCLLLFVGAQGAQPLVSLLELVQPLRESIQFDDAVDGLLLTSCQLLGRPQVELVGCHRGQRHHQQQSCGHPCRMKAVRAPLAPSTQRTSTALWALLHVGRVGTGRRPG